MKIRSRILIPMTVLTVLCSVGVFISATFLYGRVSLLISVTITALLLVACVIISNIISGAIIKKFEDMVEEVEKSRKELRQTRDVSESVSDSKAVFLANISHELRTPMNSIVGFSELAENGNISPETRNYIANIQSSAQWLLKIINEILDISKIELSKLELENIPFNLHEIIANCQTAVAGDANKKGILLYCYAEQSISKNIIGDPVRLRQVILNLLTNSIKFTNAGTINFHVSQIESYANSVKLHFEIKDSGIGMTKSQIEKILDPFQKADDVVARRYGGAGLGIPITKSIVELMGGDFNIESTSGIGTKISFDLIFDTADIEPVPILYSAKNDAPKVPRFEGSVLVCEDNILNQQLIIDHLNRIGLKPLVVDDGKKGVDAVIVRKKSNKNPFDLILMDIYMPEMDGLEATTKIKEMGVTSPIVAFTANVMPEDLVEYEKNGMSGTLAKPFTSEDLWECLANYLPKSYISAESMVSESVDTRYSSYATPPEQIKANERETEIEFDDEYILRRLKTGFCKSHSNTIKKVKDAISEGDIEFAHRQIHTLKGISGQLGEHKLHLIAKEAEYMLKDGVNNLTDEKFSELEDELTSVLNRYVMDQ